MHEGHARPGWTTSRHGQDSLWKSQSKRQRTGINRESTSMMWPTLGWSTAKEQNRTLPLHCPPVLWRCWLGGRKGIWPVTNWVVGCWHGYLSGMNEVQTCKWPSECHCHSLLLLQQNLDQFTFLVPAHLGSPGQRAVKQGCVCVCKVINCFD